MYLLSIFFFIYLLLFFLMNDGDDDDRMSEDEYVRERRKERQTFFRVSLCLLSLKGDGEVKEEEIRNKTWQWTVCGW